jgi:putative sigma-54 modulation protein
MEIKISHEQIELTDAIKSYVTEKIEKLATYMPELLVADVWVGKTTNHHAKGDIFESKANLTFPGGMFNASSTNEDLYDAIAETKNRLKEQILDSKERATDGQKVRE